MEDTVKTEEERLAMRLSKLDPEKFLTLCRMHLSFILELDSGTLEMVGHSFLHSKSQTKKIFAPILSKKSKFLGAKDVDVLCQTQVKDGRALYQLIDYLGLEMNMTQEGLFRKSGKVSRQDEMLKIIKSGNLLSLENGDYSVHDCASVLKKFLSELPEPLLTEQHYRVHCKITDLCLDSYVGEQKISATNRQIEALQLLLWLLPNKNRRMLRQLLSLLHKVSKKQAGNRMDASNLATLFAPHILCPRKMSAEEFCNNSGNMIKSVSFMIENALDLFNLPEGLARDLKVLWVSKSESKSTDILPQSEECENNVFEEDAVTTLTTFCERQPTGQSNASATEVALAQLYAHVQTLPESSKKKQLIKQFNKENGPGTPLCRERPRNHQRSRSLKKSLKKHLFGRHNRCKSSEMDTMDCEVIENSAAVLYTNSSSQCQLKNVRSLEFSNGIADQYRTVVKTSQNHRQTEADKNEKFVCDSSCEKEENLTGCTFCGLRFQSSSIDLKNGSHLQCTSVLPIKFQPIQVSNTYSQFPITINASSKLIIEPLFKETIL